MRKHKPLFTADTVHQGVRHMAALNAQAIKAAPDQFGPMSRIEIEQPAEEPPEILEGHCLKCKGKKSFQVDPARTKKMKSGAVMKQGKCLEPGCNTMMSTFTKAGANAA